MEKTLEEKIAIIIAKAKLLGNGGSKPRSATRNGSSLHRIIRTPAQAEAFMKSLREASANRS